MFPAAELKNLLVADGLSTKDMVLLCLAVDSDRPKQVKDITKLGFDAGWRGIKKLNVSAILSSCKPNTVRTGSGWELTATGFQYVAQLAGPLMGSPVPKVASSLRIQLAKLNDPDTKRFVEEAVACFEARQHRAAVVLSWVGAISVLQAHVFTNHLAAFNTEASRRDSKWRTAKNTDDLGRMKEHGFLDVLEAISVIGKNVKQELQKQLQLRNGCGHPNSLNIAEHTVSSHIEILILNVYSCF